MPAPAPDSLQSVYRLAAPVRLRLMGAVFAGAGLLIVILSVVALLVDRLAAGLLAGLAVALLALMAAGLLLGRGAVVVRLDTSGYRVRMVRGAGVTQGSWKDVEDVVATTVSGQRCVVLRRRDGTTTTIPVDILAGSADDFVRDLQQHLDRGHGYRPVR